MIGIIDYEVGNPKSIANILKRVGCPSRIFKDPKEISEFNKVILPGVGAFDYGMKQLRKLGFQEAIEQHVLERQMPFLGICLGAQLLTKGSAEGNEAGFGFFDGHTKRFDFSKLPEKLSVPHMGWNRVKFVKTSLLVDQSLEWRFYFVHSFHFVVENPQDVLANTNYGYEFPSALSKGNVFALQFHPEKSHGYGMRLLKQFGEGF